jgi:hypothetical protein
MAMLISPVSNSFDPLMQFLENLCAVRHGEPTISNGQPDKFRVGRILGHLQNRDRA